MWWVGVGGDDYRDLVKLEVRSSILLSYLVKTPQTAHFILLLSCLADLIVQIVSQVLVVLGAVAVGPW